MPRRSDVRLTRPMPPNGSATSCGGWLRKSAPPSFGSAGHSDGKSGALELYREQFRPVLQVRTGPSVSAAAAVRQNANRSSADLRKDRSARARLAWRYRLKGASTALIL